MENKLFIIVIFLFICSFLVSAEVTVDYIEGLLELKEGSNWIEVNIGDAISDNAILHLSEQGYVEILVRESIISLIRDGTYNVLTLARESIINRASSFDLLNKITLNTGHEKIQHKLEPVTSGVMGITYNDSNRVKYDYVGQEYLFEGIEEYSSGNFDIALLIFSEGWEFYEDYNCLLLKAICFDSLGMKGDYIRTLKKIDIDLLSEKYAIIFGIRFSEILIRSTEYSEALEILKEIELNNEQSKGNMIQIHFLIGIACLGVGEFEDAKASFQKVESLDPSSVYGYGEQANQLILEITNQNKLTQ